MRVVKGLSARLTVSRSLCLNTSVLYELLRLNISCIVYIGLFFDYSRGKIFDETSTFESSSVLTITDSGIINSRNKSRVFPLPASVPRKSLSLRVFINFPPSVQFPFVKARPVIVFGKRASLETLKGVL